MLVVSLAAKIQKQFYSAVIVEIPFIIPRISIAASVVNWSSDSFMSI
jgi:hypothetical protein